MDKKDEAFSRWWRHFVLGELFRFSAEPKGHVRNILDAQKPLMHDAFIAGYEAKQYEREDENDDSALLAAPF